MSQDYQPYVGRDGVEVECRCGRRFAVPNSLRGGLANCPQCHKAVEVRGGFEALYWSLYGCGVVAALAISGLTAWLAGPIAGAIVFGVCALILVLVLFMS